MTLKKQIKTMKTTYAVILIIEIFTFCFMNSKNEFMSSMQIHDWMLIISLGLFVPMIAIAFSFCHPSIQLSNNK